MTAGGEPFRPYRWDGDALHLIDQRRLPQAEEWLRCRTVDQVAEAIRTLAVRGAPAIGVAAAFGLALAAREAAAGGTADVLKALEDAGDRLRATRPTAVNLFWAIDRILARARELAAGGATPGSLAAELEREAVAIADEDLRMNLAIGAHGAPLIPDSGGVLTYCNTGALATAGHGTALGVIRSAWAAGKRFRVYAAETRPVMQGARLTTWELGREGIPVTLIADAAAGLLMRRGEVGAVIVGADRIAANGDVANKIGTYTLAVLARAHDVPFYVAAPRSTVDFGVASGERIPIEERSPDEVTHVRGVAIAPEGVPAWNPAFDVTPASLISGIITDAGVARPPYEESLRRLLGTA